ncbi:ATP-binding protein [Martelella lutilitoris]|uniref:ATP-binding protein n=1 Tax=Martelella lutilitoris TaxID=2583532 RepID=A0A5C4JMH9_9HYPH|nr:ATP-binding protein [Martelella lutilitoris]TNB46507.1 ATP-binding protein [Martelella lutilitoris]
MRNDPFAPVEHNANSAVTTPASGWTAVAPVPDNAEPPPVRHSRLGTPSQRWCYRNASGKLLFIACRFDTNEGKQFLPLSYGRDEQTSANGWRWKGLPEPRPLYRLDRLEADPDVAVIITEGEKAADAAAAMLPGFFVTTSPNGSKSARKADWSPLSGRRVIIWPDADEPGAAYAEAVVQCLTQAGAASVSVIRLSQGLPAGFDAADAFAEGWTDVQLQALIPASGEAGVSAAVSDADDGEAEGAAELKKQRKKKPSAFDFLPGEIEFWHDPDRESHVTYPTGDHFEHWPVRHRFFKSYVAGVYYEKTGEALGSSALDDTIRIMEAKAQSGACYPTFRRVGSHDGDYFLDLCDQDWRAVRVTKGRWTVGQFPHVKFLRSASARALPEPQRGAGYRDLKPFINVGSEQDLMLVTAWLVAALRPEGPYPLLCVSGEQGSGKSSVTDLLANLIDAEIGKKRTVSKDERDLVIAAKNGHVLAFDNMSSVANWFSDSLCRLSTGGGFATRALHTDNEQIVLEAQRPVILNGIPDLTGRADLSDRAIAIHLPRIPEEERQTERHLKEELERMRPYLLGALLDAVSEGLSRRASVKLANPPRMADFAEWIEACSPAFGWEPGQFLEAYRLSRTDAAKVALENDPFGSELIRIIKRHRATGFSGTATHLLEVLNEHAAPAIKNMRVWPSTAATLGTLVRRAAPLLRSEGYAVTDSRTAEGRMIIIRPLSSAHPNEETGV